MNATQPAPASNGIFMLTLVALIWLGMLLGVSALATPIKFQAVSLTLPVALDVGQTTFAAFNKMEWLLSVLLILAVMLSRLKPTSVPVLLTATAVVVVLLQTLWLLPALDVRVAAVIAGEPMPSSQLHNLYVVAEGIKLLALVVIGVGALLRLMNGRPV